MQHPPMQTNNWLHPLPSHHVPTSWTTPRLVYLSLLPSPSTLRYQTDDTMARSPGRVMELLENVWGRAKV